MISFLLFIHGCILGAGSLKLDHDACANIESMIAPSHEELRDLKSSHYHRTVEITENAGKCLEEDYVVSTYMKDDDDDDASSSSAQVTPPILSCFYLISICNFNSLRWMNHLAQHRGGGQSICPV